MIPRLHPGESPLAAGYSAQPLQIVTGTEGLFIEYSPRSWLAVGELIGNAQHGSNWNLSKQATEAAKIAAREIGKDVVGGTIRGTISGLANSGAYALVTGEKPYWGLVAAQSFGSSLGNAVTENAVAKAQEASELRTRRAASASFDISRYEPALEASIPSVKMPELPRIAAENRPAATAGTTIDLSAFLNEPIAMAALNPALAGDFSMPAVLSNELYLRTAADSVAPEPGFIERARQVGTEILDKSWAVAAIEVGATALSGTARTVVEGWGGILTGGDIEAGRRFAAEWVPTYTPQSSAGQTLGGYVGAAGEWIDSKVDIGRRAIGDSVFELTGSAALGAAGYTFIDGVGSIIPGGSAFGAVGKGLYNGAAKGLRGLGDSLRFDLSAGTRSAQAGHLNLDGLVTSTKTGLRTSTVISAERAEAFLLKNDFSAARAKDFVDSFEGPITARLARSSEDWLRYTDVADSNGRFLTKTQFSTPSEAVRDLYLLPEFNNRATLVQGVSSTGRSIVLEGAVKNGGAGIKQTLVVDLEKFYFGTGKEY